MPMNDHVPPWRHESELALLRDDFYPAHATPDPFSKPTNDRRQRAVDVVNVYIFRNPFTPHAVVATASLTEAQIQHEKEHIPSLPTNVLRNIYGMAFVKFVNGFVDRDVAAVSMDVMASNGDDGTNVASYDEEIDSDEAGAEPKSRIKGGGESSMYAYAARIDMPENFVDLRHRIVHGEIPSLATLDEYTRKGLEWLWQKWWQNYATGDPAMAREEEAGEMETANLARRLSQEKWQAYAQARRKNDGDVADDVSQARRQLDDRRMQRSLQAIDVDGERSVTID